MQELGIAFLFIVFLIIGIIIGFGLSIMVFIIDKDKIVDEEIQRRINDEQSKL